MPHRFDQAYYDRWYKNRRTRAISAKDVAARAQFVLGYLKYLGLARPRRVLDLGCGLGLWRDALAPHLPTLAYTGVEVSPFLCREHGWEQAALETYRPTGTFDFVICQSVLQYLDDRACARALAMIARACKGALYLEILTRADWRHVADRARTDGAVHMREGAWYRRRLARNFVAVGGGLFIRSTACPPLFELERV